MRGISIVGSNTARWFRSSRLAVPFRPASSGQVRYWQDHTRLAVKGAIAAVVAWVLAKYAVGQPDPYFAPLAALLGVYPTVARSPQHARESLRWNPRPSVSRRVPRPDTATLDALEKLTTRTRAVARSLIDTTTEHPQPQLPASFGEQYARLLHMIADAVRQLADQREHAPSGQELATLSGCQHQVERQAACPADRGDGQIAAQRLSRLSAEMIREIGRP